MYGAFDRTCGYIAHLLSRFEKYFPKLSDFVAKIVWLVPRLHIYNHTDLCRWLRSFVYTLGVGYTDGEACERAWAEAIKDISSTREMTFGHRHDYLNDRQSEHNFTKLIMFGLSLLVRYITTLLICLSSHTTAKVPGKGHGRTCSGGIRIRGSVRRQPRSRRGMVRIG